MTTTYTAEVYREDGWWMIRIPDLDLLTQAENWAEVDYMGRGVIASDLDISMSDVALDVTVLVDAETRRLLDLADRLAVDAEKARGGVLAARQEAARRLHGDGFSYRLIGRVMGLTHQRAEQLVKGTR